MFESFFLPFVGFDASPLTTPTSFARLFISYWPQNKLHPYLVDVAEGLIGKCFEGECSACTLLSMIDPPTVLISL
jgi:hypothetical protein